MNSRVSSKGTGRKPKHGRLIITEEQRMEIESAFRTADLDKNNMIDKEELRICIKAMGLNATKDEIDHVIDEKGEGSRQMLSFQSFQEFIGPKIFERNSTKEIKRAFDLFKDGGQGNITIDDLRKIAKEMSKATETKLTEEDLQLMIREFDVDGDGEISMAEFISIMDPTNSA